MFFLWVIIKYIVTYYTMCENRLKGLTHVVFSGSESRVLRHLQRRHWLPVDRHHWRETWKLHPQGSWPKSNQLVFKWFPVSRSKPPASSSISNVGQCKSQLPGARVWLQQQYSPLWRTIHRKLRLCVRMSYFTVSVTFLTNTLTL